MARKKKSPPKKAGKKSAARKPSPKKATAPEGDPRRLMEELRRDDPRLGELISNLSLSTNIEARETLAIGARRFFEGLDELAQARIDRANGWPTLAEMFREDDYLIHALVLTMDPSIPATEPGAELAQELARLTLSHLGRLPALGTAWGRAMQVVAAHRMEDLAYLARGYVVTFRDGMDHERGQQVPPEMIVNLAESAIAAARLDPENMQPILRDLFEADYGSPDYREDVLGAVLAGLLVLEPDAEDVRQWAEALLREGLDLPSARLYGILAGVGAAKLEWARSWVLPHVGSEERSYGRSSQLIGAAARRAIESLDRDSG